MNKKNNLLIMILAIGVFGILNTEVGVIGILPVIAENFHVSISKAGLLVSMFALIVAISGPIMPMLFSGINRKKIMLLVLGIFTLGNIVSMFTINFSVLLMARIIPAFFHPIYCSMALTLAATSVKKEEVPKAISKIMMGVSAGVVFGIPVTNYIASVTSLKMTLLFFTLINFLALISTIIFIPSIPVKEKLSYGTQLRVLRKKITWMSLIGVMFIGSSSFAVYAYIAEYLRTITNISGKSLSLALFLLGIASILGNFLAGKTLTKNPMNSVIIFPVALGIIYILFFFLGKLIIPMFIVVFIYGVLNGVGGSIQQYWIASAIPEAPDFANGLFLSAGNLGTTIGTAIGGIFISRMGIHYIIFGGLIFLALSFIFILLRYYKYNFKVLKTA